MSFTETLFHEGTISVLYGLPESGKTNFMVFLSEKAAIKHNYNVWSVIHFFPKHKLGEAIREGLLPGGIQYMDQPGNVHTVKKVSDLLLGVLEKKNNVTILDEAGVFASTRAPMKKKLRFILNLSYIIRHLRSSFVYVTQTKQSIPEEMRIALVKYEMTIRKAQTGVRILTVKRRQDSMDKWGNDIVDFIPIDSISRIPLTTLPWDGHYIPKFKFDIDLDEAWDRLGDYDSLDVRKVGKRIIEEMVEEAQAESDKKEERKSSAEIRKEALEYATELLEEGETNRKILVSKVAKRFDRSITWGYRVLTGFKV